MTAVISIDWEGLVRVSSALLTPLIAVLATLIALQQSRTAARATNIASEQQKTNRNHFRLALLEKRLTVFNGAGNLIATVMTNARIGPDGLGKFLVDTREAAFLFGPDITAYLDELYGKAADVHAFEDAVNEEDRAQRRQALLWFAGQGAQLKQKFGTYMSFKEPD